MTQFYEQVQYIAVAITLGIAIYLIVSISVALLLEGGDTAAEHVATKSHNHIVMENLLDAQEETPRAVFTEEFIFDTDRVVYREEGEGICYMPEVTGLDGERTSFRVWNPTTYDEIDLDDEAVRDDCGGLTSQIAGYEDLVTSRIIVKTSSGEFKPFNVGVYEIQ